MDEVLERALTKAETTESKKDSDKGSGQEKQDDHSKPGIWKRSAVVTSTLPENDISRRSHLRGNQTWENRP